MGQYQRQADDKDKSGTKVHQPLGALIGCIQLASAHAFAHQNRSSIGKTRKEADNQPFQRTEYGGGCDCLLRLTAQHHVDDHVANADQDFVHQNGKTFMKILRHKGFAPDKVTGDTEQIRMFLHFSHQQDHQRVNACGANSRQSRSLNTHGGKTEAAVDQHPIQKDIGRHRGNRAIQRNTYPVRGAQKSAHRHGVHLQRVGETNDPKILNADFLNGRFVGIDTHNEFGEEQRERGKDDRVRHHAEERHAIGTVHAVVILRSVILGKKQHTAAHKTPVSREHQRRKLSAQSHCAHAQFAKRGDHHGIHHAAGGGQQVLKRNRDRNDRHTAQKFFPRESGSFRRHKESSFNVQSCPV